MFQCALSGCGLASTNHSPTKAAESEKVRTAHLVRLRKRNREYVFGFLIRRADLKSTTFETTRPSSFGRRSIRSSCFSWASLSLVSLPYRSKRIFMSLRKEISQVERPPAESSWLIRSLISFVRSLEKGMWLSAELEC